MLKAKREELVKLIVQKAGLPSDGSYVDYLTRQQLLELHSFLDVHQDKINLAISLIKNIDTVLKHVDAGEDVQERISDLLIKAKEILDVSEKNSDEERFQTRQQ